METCAAERSAMWKKAELRRHALTATFPKDVALVVAIWAGKMAHVLDHTKRRNLKLLVHRHGSAAVGQRHGLRRCDDDGTRYGNCLAQTQGHVARPGRHIDHEIVQLIPKNVLEELPDHTVKHRTTPDDRSIVGGEVTVQALWNVGTDFVFVPFAVISYALGDEAGAHEAIAA